MHRTPLRKYALHMKYFTVASDTQVRKTGQEKIVRENLFNCQEACQGKIARLYGPCISFKLISWNNHAYP